MRMAEAAVCGGLAAALDDAGGGAGFALAALGVRDELRPDGAPVPAGRVPVQIYGRHALVGPMPDPAGRTRPCSRCLARRWQAARQRDLRDAIELGGDAAGAGDSGDDVDSGGTAAAGASPYATPFAAAALISVAAAHRDARTGPDVDGTAVSAPGVGTGTVYHVDLESLRVRRLRLVPDPECPGCGRMVDDTEAAAPLELAPAPKLAPDVFRSRDVTGYGLAVDAYTNPLCGALGPTMWTDLTSRSTSPVIGAFTLRTGPYLRETLFGGHTDSYRLSAAVGVLEGMERAAGLRPRGKRTVVRASLDELGGDALDPRQCGLYHDAFYEANPYVRRFTPDARISWVWGWSLRDHRALLVPEALAYYHAVPVEDRFVQANSNGCASGGSLAEAAYHGLMEVVERDAFLLAWYGRQPLPEIDPRTSSRLRTRSMVDRLAMYGYRARFFDTRMTFDIPVVTGVAVREDRGFGTLAFGAGASLDPEAALAAALCEIATDSVMVGVRAGAELARLRPMVDDYSQVLGLHDHPLLYGLPEMARHAEFLIGDAAGGPRPCSVAGTYPVRPITTSLDLRDDLDRCVKAMAERGFDVVAVDQTMPEQRDLGLHTVNVLVPGLLPIDFGWLRQRAPRSPRLRTALRAAGRRERDLRPDEINPAPHPFP